MFQGITEVHNYVAASAGMRERAARDTPVRGAQEPDTTQHTSMQKLVFTMSSDLNNVSVVK